MLKRLSTTNAIANGPANGRDGHARLPHHEYLKGYRDLVLWGGHAGILNSNAIESLLKEAQVDSAEAGAVYQRGLELRETIFRLFSCVAGGKHADIGDLEILNATLRTGIGHAQLVRSGEGFELGWDDEPCLERPLRVVTESAIRLLTSPQVHGVRQCEGEGCDWLFVDTSRNHMRKRCSMEECGNRAKMRRRKWRSWETLVMPIQDGP